LCDRTIALKVSYRTAEASLGLQTEVEAHTRIWKALSDRGHMPSPHLCLASFVVYSDVSLKGESVPLIDGLAMPCVEGTLWDFWNLGASDSTPLAAGAAVVPEDSANPVEGGLRASGESATELSNLLWMALTLADGLCSLHAADSVHNDLHPQNVGVRRLPGGPSGSRVAAAYESHVLDLGRVVTSGTACERFRNDGSFWPVWHPPEAIHDERKAGDKVVLSPAADVWAFGCILVSLLRGSAPEFALAEGWSPAKWESLASGSLWREALQSVEDDRMGLKAAAKECLCNDPAKRPAMRNVRNTLSACVQRAGFGTELITCFRR
jgi:Protein tyrosine and serine/threonine kinase